MAAFDYHQAQEIRDAFARHGVRYLFIGKSGAVLLGYSDTTQDVDPFVEKSPENGKRAAAALAELGFDLTPEQRAEVEFVQIRHRPRLRPRRDRVVRGSLGAEGGRGGLPGVPPGRHHT